ncbi:MAG: FIST C-terminal domain-containing protein [Verrucomicrobiota bacterium]
MKTHLPVVAAAFFLVLFSGNLGAAVPLVGIGQSGSEDAKVAGKEAAAEAKTALGSAAPKIVLVFAAHSQLTPQLVEGVAEIFDKALIYGCEGYSSLTSKGNFAERGTAIPAGISVMAIGGDVAFTAASAAVRNPAENAEIARVFHENGKALGAALKEAWSAAPAGRLIITFGNQHIGSNQPLVDGVAEVLGTDVKMVGAAAGTGGAKEIVRGEIVTRTNIAILMTGHFKVNTAAANGEAVQTADAAFKTVLGNGGDKAALIFVFDCGGRRGNMVNAGTLVQEWQAMKTNAGTIPFFGFYGGGEIGHKTLEAPCQGVGGHIATAAVIPQ